jgi:hypothetical protein
VNELQDSLHASPRRALLDFPVDDYDVKVTRREPVTVDSALPAHVD